MNLKELARRVAAVGNVLVTASVFFVLIWWRVSLYLFLAGWVVFGLAWLMDGAFTPAPASIAQE